MKHMVSSYKLQSLKTHRFTNQVLMVVFDLNLWSKYQQENATLAVKVVEQLSETLSLTVDQTKIAQGLKQAFWPARMEALHGYITKMVRIIYQQSSA